MHQIKGKLQYYTNVILARGHFTILHRYYTDMSHSFVRSLSIDQIAKKTRPLIYTLLDLKRPCIPTSTMLQFYTTCIRPIILYACPSWFSMLSKEQQQHSENAQKTRPLIHLLLDLKRSGIPTSTMLF